MEMMLKTIPLMMIAMSLSLMMISTPLTLGLWVLTIALLTTLLIMMLSSSWLAMIIFLIYIGGLLVLFAYFLAIQPNQFMNISSYMLSSLITLSLLKMTANNHFISSLTYTNNQMMSMTFVMSNWNLSFLTILASVLLLILIVVVKITNSKSGPLRPYH